MAASPVGEPMPFKTPEAAAEALLAAFKNNDDEALAALFGAKYRDRLLSKDKAAARESRERIYQAAQKSLTFRKDTEDRVVLVIGPEAWPFPDPPGPERRRMALPDGGGDRGNREPAHRRQRARHHRRVPGLPDRPA